MLRNFFQCKKNQQVGSLLGKLRIIQLLCHIENHRLPLLHQIIGVVIKSMKRGVGYQYFEYQTLVHKIFQAPILMVNFVKVPKVAQHELTYHSSNNSPKPSHQWPNKIS
jgi:hypothetical protein